MKTRFSILKLEIVLFSTCAGKAVNGQTTFTWTNQTGGDLFIAANWDPNGVPIANAGDTMRWDGRTVGNLFLTATNPHF